jgi:hypothetical protein
VAGGSVARLRGPGIYIAEGGGSRTALPVNVGDPRISNLSRSAATSSGQVRLVTGGDGGRPWWMYCAIAAFVLAATEWWTWQRRITV